MQEVIGVSMRGEEIVVPSLQVSAGREILHEDVRDVHRDMKGMVALQQQLYFSSLEAFQKLTDTKEEPLLKIIFENPGKKGELVQKLTLFGLTQVDMVVTPGTVVVRYPKYDRRWEYRNVDIYNEVFIESSLEHPAKILRIRKEGNLESELFIVKKRDSWEMGVWPEILLYPHREFFEKRVNELLDFFGVSRERFDYAVSLTEKGQSMELEEIEHIS